MAVRALLICFMALYCLSYSEVAQAQHVQIQFDGAAALPDKQLNDALGYNAQDFEELQKKWTASALPE